MRQVMKAYIEHLQARHLKPHTIADYERALRVFIQFIEDTYPDVTDIAAITKDMVRGYEKYITTLKDNKGDILSIERRGKYLSMLKSWFLYLQKEDIIYANPAATIALPKAKKRIVQDVLTIEEMETLLRSCSGQSILNVRDRAIMELLYSTGMRSDELCNIEIRDIDFDEQTVFVRKGKMGNQRVIPFGESAKYWVYRYLEKIRPIMTEIDTEIVFISLRGNKLVPDTLGRMIKKRAIEAGLEKNVTTHTFRHSCATHMLKGRADIRYVQKQLGHRFISTTEKYLKIEISDLKEVHERTHPREQDDWDG